ncbi:peptidoglycan-associated lipoprotein Pal [Xylophilus sp.]|uniref:peptidoglycan-associated lipoprotein Pal n=1 Tax=Xylophilus sp. TaxID=2653893 RepID=UPI0013BA598E|nr:peptidoglycan-associated lipoprotein Pal [Xylophilus sp.]KAF1046722.1 MAG: Peptidoglycan-associated lipoprotein [Xylophilus sp.]
MQRPPCTTMALALAAALLAAGCSTQQPRAGVDEKAYYYSSRTTAPAPAVVRRGEPPPVAAVPAPTQRVVYFDYDRYDVKPEYRGVVQAHADYLRGDPRRSVVLQGHTDERGGTEYNLALGQRRAEAVRRSLLLLGVSDAQVEAISYGKEKPASTEHSERGWQRNRRVEFDYR